MSFVVEAVIVSVGHDDVVDESDVHGLCGTLHDLGQVKVVVAGAYIPRRMVVYQSYLGGPADERFTQDGADIGCGLVDTSATDTYFVYDFPSGQERNGRSSARRPYPSWECGEIHSQTL